MKNLLFALLIAFSWGHQQASAQQLELPFEKQPDQTLADAYPGNANVHLVDYSQIPAKVQSTFKSVDIPVEMGDGYYDTQSNAFYAVADSAGKLVGYVEFSLLSYTEDPDYYLAGVYVNLQGMRLNVELTLSSFPVDDQEALSQLPPELQPSQN